MIVRQRTYHRQAARQSVRDLARMTAHPNSGAVDTAASAVDEDALHHAVEILFPLIDLIVTEDDLREPGTVRLNPRVAAIAVHRGGSAKDETAAAAIEDGSADIAFTRINRDR